MSIIPNFPDELLDMHHHWHMPSAHPGSGPGRVHPAGSPGGGLEFLQFHRDFVATFHVWYDSQPFADQAAVEPWQEVPAELKVPAAGWTTGWANAEIRLNTNNPAFNNADELGTFIELGIHNQFLHGAAAIIYNEPVVGTFHSPLSTYFYGIHGLVDLWWQKWESQHSRNIFNKHFAASFMQVFGGVEVDGVGSGIDSGGHIHKINPWGPVMQNFSVKQTAIIENDLKRLQTLKR